MDGWMDINSQMALETLSVLPNFPQNKVNTPVLNTTRPFYTCF